MSIRSRLAVAGLTLLCAGAPGLADGAEELTFADALQRALKQQPRLQGFAYELRVQDARAAEASLRPPASVGLLVEDFAGGGERSGFDVAQSTLSLSYLFELGGKRDARITAAEAARTHLVSRRTAAQLDAVAEVARRFIETLHERESLQLAGESLRQAEDTHREVERRVRAAIAPAAEAARAGVRVSQARLEVEHAEHQLQSARMFLAAAMGERTVQFGETRGDLFAMDPPASLDELLARVEQAPDFQSFIDEARLRDAEVRLAQAQSRPDIRGEFGLRRYEADGEFALVAGFSLPLQSASRARPGVDAAQAARLGIDAEREAFFLRVRAQLTAQYRELEHSLLESRALRTEIIPQLEDALQRTEYAFQRGRYSYLELTDAQRELLLAKQRAADVAVEFHILRVEIERLSGQGLETAEVSP